MMGLMMMVEAPRAEHSILLPEEVASIFIFSYRCIQILGDVAKKNVTGLGGPRVLWSSQRKS